MQSNATRLAALGLAKTLSTEVASDKVLVNVISPGPIATDRMAELLAAIAEQEHLSEETARAKWINEARMRRIGKPDDVATMTAFLSSPRCSFTTGAVIPIDGGKARDYGGATVTSSGPQASRPRRDWADVPLRRQNELTMHVYRASEATSVEPEGHFGGRSVSDIVSRAKDRNFAVPLSYCPPGGGGEKHSHDATAQLLLVIEGDLTFDTRQEGFTLDEREGVKRMGRSGSVEAKERLGLKKGAFVLPVSTEAAAGEASLSITPGHSGQLIAGGESWSTTHYS